MKKFIVFSVLMFVGVASHAGTIPRKFVCKGDVSTAVLTGISLRGNFFLNRAVLSYQGEESAAYTAKDIQNGMYLNVQASFGGKELNYAFQEMDNFSGYQLSSNGEVIENAVCQSVLP